MPPPSLSPRDAQEDDVDEDEEGGGRRQRQTELVIKGGGLSPSHILVDGAGCSTIQTAVAFATGYGREEEESAAAAASLLSPIDMGRLRRPRAPTN